MKVYVTEAEFDRMSEYSRLRAENPCKECESRSYCTGCPDRDRWDAAVKETGVDGEKFTGPVAEFIECQQQLAAIHYKINELSKEFAALEGQKKQLMDLFEVVE